MNKRRWLRFSLWQVFVAMVIISLIFARWKTTTVRREAYDELTWLPCGLLSEDEGPFLYPGSIGMSVRVVTSISDFFFPPRIIAIDVQDRLDETQRQVFLSCVKPFPELRRVYLPPDATENEIRFWREHLPDHISVNQVPASAP